MNMREEDGGKYDDDKKDRRNQQREITEMKNKAIMKEKTGRRLHLG